MGTFTVLSVGAGQQSCPMVIASAPGQPADRPPVGGPGCTARRDGRGVTHHLDSPPCPVHPSTVLRIG